MRASLYTLWHCIAQRPHHLAGVMLRRGWQVNVFASRAMRAKAPTLPITPHVQSQLLLSQRLYPIPVVGNLARTANSARERAVLRGFAQSSAEILVYQRRPQAWGSELKSCYLVYDCLDDWEGFTGSETTTSAREAELCERADQVWVVSRHLEKKLARWGKKVRYVPNGVDVLHFTRARTMNETSRVLGSRPKATYIGALSDWFDARLVGEIAQRLRDWDIDLIGPQNLSAQQRRWLDQPNVRLLGRCEYQDLPLLLAQANVALIPFIINDLIRGTSPIKLYEYLAAGIPVVATPMPEVLPYVEQGVVACADNPNEFAQMIEESAHSANPDRCQEVGRASSWDARFGPLLEGLETQFSVPTGL